MIIVVNGFIHYDSHFTPTMTRMTTSRANLIIVHRLDLSFEYSVPTIIPLFFLARSSHETMTIIVFSSSLLLELNAFIIPNARMIVGDCYFIAIDCVIAFYYDAFFYCIDNDAQF